MQETTSIPTLQDVAREARVSTATVSRCLNSPDLVAEGTRQRVMSAVDALGYTPNFGARVMAAKRTFTIGAIIPTMDNAIFARGLQAFQEELHATGYTLLVASSAYRSDLEEEQIRTFVLRGADGLLLIGHDRADTAMKYLNRQAIPTLVAWTFSDKAKQPSVGFDNRSSMRKLAEEVLRKGHKRIGMISGISLGNDRARQRIEGVREAIEAASLDPSHLDVIETHYAIDQGAKAFSSLMALPVPPTAVMCGNDVLAVGAIRRAKEMGILVPHQVSITGFDDLELAEIADPPLTTVHVPHRKMGREAARELVRMVEGKSEGVSVELETTLKVRATLGSPPTDSVT